MTTKAQPDDLVQQFHEAGALDPAAVQFSRQALRLAGADDDLLGLAVALAVRQVMGGSACVDLGAIQSQVTAELLSPEGEPRDAAVASVADLPWPEPDAWLSALRDHDAVAGAEEPINARLFRLVDRLFYLERWWAFEDAIVRRLAARQATPSPEVEAGDLKVALDAVFDRAGLGPDEPDLQRAAAESAATSWTSIIAGGPGTGKTATVARVLSVLARLSEQPLTVALAAPSGKAAARLEQAVSAEFETRLQGQPMPTIPRGQTLHSLLGSNGLGNGFRRSPLNPVPHDIVVLDEVSMVDLTMFSHLLGALRPTTRLIILGDPSQLSSVDAGRVLADLASAPSVRGPGDDRPAMVTLEHNWRNPGDIDRLARAIRAGDVDATREVLADHDDSIVWIEDDLARIDADEALRSSLLAQGRALHEAGLRGDADAALVALDDHRILCAHREGPHGVSHWSQQQRELLRHEVDGYGTDDPEWWAGRPLLVTANSRSIEVFNGDAGVIVRDASGAARLAIGDPGRHRLLAPSLVDGLEDLYAMTVHKSQGSQFREVTVVLPPPTSPLLSREMLYTAITRAQQRVRIIAPWESLAAAVELDTQRVSGMARRWERLGEASRVRVDAADPAPF